MELKSMVRSEHKWVRYLEQIYDMLSMEAES